MSKLSMSDVLHIDYHQDTNFTTVITNISRDDFFTICAEQKWVVIKDDNGDYTARYNNQLMCENYTTPYSSDYKTCTVFYSRSV